MVQSRSDLDDLPTEAGSNAVTGFERRPTIELVELMNAGDSTVPDAVAAAATSIADAVDAISAQLRDGGRLVYVGAGSSGRIAALDASECESTFSTAPGIVVAVVAVPSLRLLYFENTSPAADLTIKVTGKMWSWTYEYPDYGNFSFDAPMLSNNAAEKARELNPPGTDNHIVVPVGKTVRIVTIGTNLIYSCAIPSIGAWITGLPRRTDQSWFKAAKEGRYYGECFELCGLPHAFKPIEVEVVSPKRFDQWVAEARSRLAAER